MICSLVTTPYKTDQISYQSFVRALDSIIETETLLSFCQTITLKEMPPTLRPEILQQTNTEGLVSFLDPLLQQKYHLNMLHSASFLSGEWSEELISFLEESMLLEGLSAESIRRTVWNSTAMTRAMPQQKTHPEPNWELLHQLPDLLQPQWQKKESWQRLLERARAGNLVFRLDNFIQQKVLLDSLSELSFSTYQTGFLTGQRCSLHNGPLLRTMNNLAVRHLCSCILNMPLAGDTLAYGWKLEQGDYIGSHADGTKYVGTLTLGCNHQWKAQYGGAISFGVPLQESFYTLSQWLPELGDALLFRPRSNLWHAVEEVQQGCRYTMTGWWLEEGLQAHHH